MAGTCDGCEFYEIYAGAHECWAVPQPTIRSRKEEAPRRCALFRPAERAQAPVSAELSDPRFDQFWAAYPKRPNAGKVAASKSFAAAMKRGVDFETLLLAAKRYARSRDEEDDDPKYTAMASTWLNQDRYLDWESEESPEVESARLASYFYG